VGITSSDATRAASAQVSFFVILLNIMVHLLLYGAWDGILGLPVSSSTPIVAQRHYERIAKVVIAL
jgi:hypothetical protein